MFSFLDQILVDYFFSYFTKSIPFVHFGDSLIHFHILNSICLNLNLFRLNIIYRLPQISRRRHNLLYLLSNFFILRYMIKLMNTINTLRHLNIIITQSKILDRFIRKSTMLKRYFLYRPFSAWKHG